MADELTTPSPQVLTPTASAQPTTLDLLFNAIHGQESSYGANPSTSSTGARGDMQIEPSTFVQFAQPGERIDNRDDNLRVGRRILGYYLDQYQDPARAAVAYFSGPGNVSPPGSPYPFIHNFADPSGKTTASYVMDVDRRMKYPMLSARGSGGSGGSPQSSSLTAEAPLTLSQITPREPPSFLESIGQAVSSEAKQQQAAAPAKQQQAGPPIQPPGPGPLGLQAQQAQPQPPPSQMERYLALLRAGHQQEAASG